MNFELKKKMENLFKEEKKDTIVVVVEKNIVTNIHYIFMFFQHTNNTGLECIFLACWKLFVSTLIMVGVNDPKLMSRGQ